MASSFDPGALLGHSYALPRGPRVRLRLARPGDRPAIRALLARQGVELEELELARLTQVDPRRRVVICATALVELRELIVGVAATSLSADDDPGLDMLLVDHELTEGLDHLLTQAVVGRASALARSRAA